MSHMLSECISWIVHCIPNCWEHFSTVGTPSYFSTDHVTQVEDNLSLHIPTPHHKEMGPAINVRRGVRLKCDTPRPLNWRLIRKSKFRHVFSTNRTLHGGSGLQPPPLHFAQLWKQPIVIKFLYWTNSTKNNSKLFIAKKIWFAVNIDIWTLYILIRLLLGTKCMEWSELNYKTVQSFDGMGISCTGACLFQNT